MLVLIEAVPIGLMRAALPSNGAPELLRVVLDVLLIALLYPAAIFTAAAPNAMAPGPMLEAAVRRYGSSLAVFLLSAAWSALWVLVTTVLTGLAMAPFLATRNLLGAGIAAAVAGGAAGLALLPRAGLVAAIMVPIVILERRSPWEALTSARRRVNQAGFVRSSLLGLAIFAVTIAPILVVGSALDALAELTHVAALRALEELITDAVTLGLGIVLSTVVALDMRARYEGADLEAELDAAVPSSKEAVPRV